MDNQVKRPRAERADFLTEQREKNPGDLNQGGGEVESEQAKEKLKNEPLVASFEVRPELLDKPAKKNTEEEVDEDQNGVADEDDELITDTFKGTRAEENGTSSRVESLISRTDARILHKERDPYKFMNYWKRMKVVALEEWFNRKIGEGGFEPIGVETQIGAGQEAGKTLEILQGRRKEDIQQNVVENTQKNDEVEQIDVVEKSDDLGGETAA